MIYERQENTEVGIQSSLEEQNGVKWVSAMGMGFTVTLSYMIWSRYSSVCLHAGDAKNTVAVQSTRQFLSTPSLQLKAWGFLEATGLPWTLDCWRSFTLMLVNNTSISSSGGSNTVHDVTVWLEGKQMSFFLAASGRCYPHLWWVFSLIKNAVTGRPDTLSVSWFQIQSDWQPRSAITVGKVIVASA